MLDRLSPKRGSRRPRKRVGRGIGSGTGKTCGRGQKGYGARAGSKRRSWFEGGQMPLARRLPKRGFKNPFRVEYQVVNVGALEGLTSSETIDAAALAKAGLVPRGDRPVKVLGEGEISKKVVLEVTAVSASARAKIEAAGGTVSTLSPIGPKPKGQKKEA